MVIDRSEGANPQSLNRYAYALNNPTTLTDPTGLDPDNPLCGDLAEWPGGSYEGSAPSTGDCSLDSYPFIPPTFPPIGVIAGSAYIARFAMCAGGRQGA